MPHHKSTAKRVRTNKRDQERNVAVRSQIRTAIRRVREQSDTKEAPEVLREAHSTLDNAVRKGITHRRTADRRKSRLAKLVNKSSKKETKG